MLTTTEVWVRIPRTMLPALADMKTRYRAPSRSSVIVRAVERYLTEFGDWVEQQPPARVGGLP